jgi:Uma2 family endonuclease
VIDPAPETQLAPTRFTVEQYFGLVEAGLLEEDDRVELLEGVVVSMSPRTARHDAGVCLVHEALRTAVGDRGVVRVQCTLVLPPHRAPEPNVAVVPGTLGECDTRHPTTALLVVEVADASLPQDRITKGRIYAAAGVPEYWILNLRDDQVEVHRTGSDGRRLSRGAHGSHRRRAHARPPTRRAHRGRRHHPGALTPGSARITGPSVAARA